MPPPPQQPGQPLRSHPGGRGAFARWILAYGSFGIPQAAAPIAFSLAALPLTGSADHGAAVVMTMTLSQIIGAVPVSRWGSRWSTVGYLRALIAIRTVALLGAAGLTALTAPLWSVALAAGVAGFVSGAAYSYIRMLLSSLVDADQLPRALGLAATLTEIVFAASPVGASLLGALSPTLAVGGLAVMGVLPLLLVPTVRARPAPAPGASQERRLALLSPQIAIWLLCGLAVESAVAAVEVGAVSRAIRFGLPPSAGIIFTLGLCLASISGGLWVSVRNRPARPRLVIALLLATVVGTVLVAGAWTLISTVVGTVLIGFCLPGQGTHFSLMVERLAPAGKRAEAFALLKTAGTLGVVATSSVLAFAGLGAAHVLATAVVTVALVLVVVRTFRYPPGSASTRVSDEAHDDRRRRKRFEP